MGIETEKYGAIALIRLTQPDSRHAVNIALMTELMERMSQAEVDPAVAVIVLTGAGTVFALGCPSDDPRLLRYLAP